MVLKRHSRFGLHSPFQAGPAVTRWLMQRGVNENCSSPSKRQIASKDRSQHGVTIEACCKAVDIVLFWRAMHCIFLWLCLIWSSFPLTALGSARHLKFIHAITPSPFSCCTTVHQWPFLSASNSLLTFCQQARWGKKHKTKTPKPKPANTGPQDMRQFEIIPSAVIPKNGPANKSGVHQHTWFSLHTVWSHCEGGKCTWFSRSLYFSTIPCVLGGFPAQRMRQYCRGVIRSKKITSYLFSNTTDCYRNTLGMPQHRFLWTQRVMNFYRKKPFGRRVSRQS